MITVNGLDELKTLVGKDGPAPWFTLVVDFEAAHIVNSEEK